MLEPLVSMLGRMVGMYMYFHIPQESPRYEQSYGHIPFIAVL